MTKETDDNSAIAGKIREVIAREGMVDEAKLTREASLEDLEIESIDMVMILQGLEEEFGIYVTMDEEIMVLKNVGDVIDTITRLVESNAQGQCMTGPAVVITGYGCVSALGNTAEDMRDALVAGRSGISALALHRDSDRLQVKIAAQVRGFDAAARFAQGAAPVFGPVCTVCPCCLS